MLVSASIRSVFCAAVLWAGAVVATPASATPFELVMVEQRGCEWCARWNAEIAPIYPKTPEGRAAPLRRMDIAEAVPAKMSVHSRVVFTPTFLLLRDGAEVGRLEGYPGGDFFWSLLAQMIERADDEEGGF